MSRRLYFLLPNPAVAKKVVNELLLARVNDKKIHLLAKDMNSLQGMPAANIFQTSDLIHGLELGLIVGGLTGIVIGALLSLSPDMFLSTGGLILVGALCGSIIGAWASAMMGSNLKNTRLRNFEKDIEKGEILLMIDVSKDRINEITNMIASHHPSVHAEGVDPNIPAFP